MKLRGLQRVLVALALLAGALSVPAQQQNLLLNPSFEEAERTLENPFDDLASSWGRWGNWMNRETVWTPVHGGACLMAYHHWQIQEDTTSGTFQDVQGTPAGANLTFAVYAFKDPDTNVESVELRIERMLGGSLINARVYPVEELRHGTWTKLTVSGTNDESGARVLIAVKPRQGGGREGCIKFDDAELTTGP